MPSLRPKANGEEAAREDLGGQMSFLEHLDELRKRLIRSMAFVLVAAFACWFLSDRIYNFLARPVMQALANAQQRQVQIDGLNGQQTSAPLSSEERQAALHFPPDDQVGAGHDSGRRFGRGPRR